MDIYNQARLALFNKLLTAATVGPLQSYDLKIYDTRAEGVQVGHDALFVFKAKDSNNSDPNGAGFDVEFDLAVAINISLGDGVGPGEANPLASKVEEIHQKIFNLLCEDPSLGLDDIFCWPAMDQTVVPQQPEGEGNFLLRIIGVRCHTKQVYP